MRQELKLTDFIGVPGMVMAITDIVTVVLAALIAVPVANYGDALGPVQFPLAEQYRLAIAATAILTATVFFWIGGYRAWRGASLYAELRLLFLGWTLVFLSLSAVALFTKTGASFSRQWAASWFIVGFILLVLMRFLLRFALRALRRKGYDTKRIALIGGGELAAHVVTQLLGSTGTGLSVVGYFDDRDCGLLAGAAPRLGGIDDILAVLIDKTTSENRVDQVWLSMELAGSSRLVSAIEQLQNTTLDVRMVPDTFGYQLLNHSVNTIAGLPVINLSISPMDEINRFIKRLEDIVLGTAMLIVTLPVLISVAVLVRLTSEGPILFRQQRHGWDGKEFSIYKFRTMVVHDTPQQKDYDSIQAKPGDQRLTPIGGMLRRYSLDELPQVMNVLMGDMSIVGPRPHPVAQNYQFMKQVDGYMRRHKVKPGITGWAQVNDLRGITDTLDKMENRVQYDLYYIENWSVGFDFWIIVLTVFKGFRHKNAF